MDRYDNLDLDLECDGGGGGVSQKAALFGGMFKRSLKSTEPSAKAQWNLPADDDLSKSSESLTDNNNTKDKEEGFKEKFKKSTKSIKEGLPQVTMTSHNPELSASHENLTEHKSSKEKSGVFGGLLKRSPKPGHVRRPSQDLLEISASNDSLTENSNTKESGGMFSGMFKKPPKLLGARTQSQEDLAAPSELSGSKDNLTVNGNTKESGGMFSGMFKKPPKTLGARTQSQDDLSEPSELSGSKDNLSVNSNTKESGGIFSGMFKKSPKPLGTRTKSQDDLSEPSELSGSNDNLSVNGNTKETGGKLSGMFKKFGARTQSQEDLSAPSELSGSSDNLSVNSNTKETGGGLSGMFKKLGARTQSKEDLTAPSELSGSTDNLSENQTKEKGGFLSGVFRKKVARSQSQDDLSVDSEVSATSDSQDKSSKGGAKSLKTKEKIEHSESTNENSSTPEKPKAKQRAGVMSMFYTDKQEKSSNTDDEGAGDNGDSQQGHKQSKLAGAMTKLNPFKAANKHDKQTSSDDEEETVSSEKSTGNKQNAMAEAMSKLNPFRSAHKKDAEDAETLKEKEKQVEEKPKPVKSNKIQQDRKERSETPTVPPRPTKEVMKGTSTNDKVKPRRTEDNQENKDMIPREKKGNPGEAPGVPARPSEEEMTRAVRHGVKKQKDNHQSQSGDEGLKEDAVTKDGDESKTTKVKKHKKPNPFMPRTKPKVASDDEGLEEDESSTREEKNEEEDKDKTEETKVKKPKRHNPFMPRVKAASDDEGLDEDDNDESSSKEEKKEEEGTDKTQQTKVKKPKRFNPFMPRVKAKVQKNTDGAAGENEAPSRTLFDQLEDFRLDPAHPEDNQDVEDLMDWWNTVEPWEDTPQDEDMTEKEEAKAFAVTADKVQKGIRVFNKLFAERAESLWQHVIDLNSIADGLDKFNKKTKIAQITGGSTSAIGGVATIAGLALAPVTMGTSLIVTAVGLGVATAGGLTSAGAGISNQVNNSMDRKKVEKIVEDYQEKMVDLNKCLKFIKQGIENLRKFDLIRMKKHAYNRDFPVLNSNFYEDGAMAGKAILINANEIMRVVQIANVAGSTAARAVQIASMATGVLTGLFVGMDIYFVAKDSKELKKGAKSEFAAKIREVATQLHDGLVELNTIREELQATTPENNTGSDGEALDDEKKKKDDEYDSSSEDEIDRIKKAIKKDYENREYV